MSSGGIRRIGVLVVLIAYWVAATVGSQFSISPPDVLYDVWYSATPLAVGLTLSFVCGFYIGRWWPVLAGLAPLATLGVLELSGHVSPWHDSGPPLTQLFQFGLHFTVSTILLFWVGPIAAGVALRKGLGPRRPRTDTSVAS